MKMRIKFTVQAYDEKWNTIHKEEGLVSTDVRMANIGAKIRDVLKPIINTIRSRAKHVQAIEEAKPDSIRSRLG